MVTACSAQGPPDSAFAEFRRMTQDFELFAELHRIYELLQNGRHFERILRYRVIEYNTENVKIFTTVFKNYIFLMH